MKKNMRVMLIVLLVLFGIVFGWKLFKSIMMKRYFASQSAPTVTVSTAKVVKLPWQPHASAVGSVRAIQGVNVTTSLAGTVRTIYFKPGAIVAAGTVLVQLNADAEIGQLNALDANAKLASITYDRDKAQYAAQAISQQVLQMDEQNLKYAQGQVMQQQAMVAKKTIRAPFDGRTGISHVNLGQYLNPGDSITSLQSLNPLFVDFTLPQQLVQYLKLDAIVVVTTDAFPAHRYVGKVTTIDPNLDNETRNITVEATIDNPTQEILPGMFVNVEMNTGTESQVMTVPQNAIAYNSYGNVVYLVKNDSTKKDDQQHLIAQQVFVSTGENRGDQVQILKGLQVGDEIVTSGQTKLKNKSPIKINNTLAPSASATPNTNNEF